ncbi:MAG TPA: hypothetical protein VG347_23650 [Verrucomicrobiae bacterium]|nr:hypothetical protein [Verrucomicrobiae bacterium]
MPEDPLAQYRKSPQIPPVGTSIPPAGTMPPKGSEEYVAFVTKDKVNRLRIHSAMAPTHSPSYNILLDIVYDGQYGTNFVLLYTVMMVLVRGKNLQKMVFAIENGMADGIFEFDPDRWEKPKDASAAFIESIEIKVIEGGMATNETKH